MSDVIKLLPDSVANQIAAGEVIQRPASVIKELVENAVDAGAKNIKIILKDAGRTLIQVIDDGCGMSETDARMAFERHATSKITKATDLYTLHTMGFRGEALPSIAAVSQIDLRTMPRGESLGTRLVINGSKAESQQPEACIPGTNMMVKNLFFNIPVRRKFLKKDSVELSNILREFERLALVNTDIEFTISHNDVTLHHLLPATFKRRIVDLFGKKLERELIPVGTDTSLVRIDGYVGLPEFARKRSPLQYLTVNGRNMRHPYFHKAIMQCYADLIATDSQPCYFINFIVDPESIDVNIHPTKNEIKFENEQPIWQILTAAIKEALSRYNVVPSIDFDRNDAPEIPPFNPDFSGHPEVKIDTSYNPFESTKLSSSASTSGRNVTVQHDRPSMSYTDWAKLYDDFNARRSMPDEGEENHSDENLINLETEFSSGGTLQIGNKYILTPARDGVHIVDQHRAHIAVLYNSYLQRAKESPVESQQVMFPESLTLSPSQSAVLKSIISDVETLGFKVENDGENIWTITAVPSVIVDTNPADTLLKMIETASETGNDVTSSLYNRIALSMAESVAIRSDRTLTSAEREQLLSQLFSLPNPRYIEDGRIIISTMTMENLMRLFR